MRGIKAVAAFGLLAIGLAGGPAAAKELPFIYGAQYYRAPTPARENWAKDLAELKARGFDTVKYWVQWRWSERKEGEYYWDDLDELMDLAGKNGLKVVLNLILDVMPTWVARDYPDSLMVGFDGRVLSGDPILCRQLGGYPGPCYANDRMTEKRQRFARAAYEHFKDKPALWGWDVWNEPETHASYRGNARYPYLCYCATCKAKFKAFCRARYGTIDRLNAIWGRCYNDFDEVEVPTMSDCVADFVDWREMQMRTLHADAEWRLRILKEVDPKSVAHLHIVVDAGGFSPLTGVDDFECAPSSEIYGSSMVNDPYCCAEGISAAQGRRFYNAEWHMNWGGHAMYPPVITRDYFLNQQLAQLGWGIFGYLFWQFRTEALGTESPAWGLINLDGTERPALKFATEFVRAFRPYADLFMKTSIAAPEVVIWRGWANEFHQYARYKREKNAGMPYHNGLRAYAKELYARSVRYGFVTTETLEKGAADAAKVLVLPQAMYLSDRDAAAFRAWRAAKPGRVILAESSLGAYDRDTNRFSATVPGKGLAADWGLVEAERTAAFHLPSDTKMDVGDGSDDVSKAMKATGVIGDNYFRLTGADGTTGWGARDFVRMAVDGETRVLASFHNVPCVVRKGSVFYAGTQLAAAAEEKEDAALLAKVLDEVLSAAEIPPSGFPKDVHVDRLYDAQGEARFTIVLNNSKEPFDFPAPGPDWTELFGGRTPSLLQPGQSVLYVRK